MIASHRTDHSQLFFSSVPSNLRRPNPHQYKDKWRADNLLIAKYIMENIACNRQPTAENYNFFLPLHAESHAHAEDKNIPK